MDKIVKQLTRKGFQVELDEKYSAKLEMAYGRFYQGYHIHCQEVMD